MRTECGTQAWSILSVAGLFLTSCVGEDRDYTIGVTYEEPGAAIAAALGDTLGPIGYSLAVTKVEDPAEIITSLADGRVELGIVDEPERMFPDIVTIAPLYPSVLHVLHAEADSPSNFDDLIRGRSVYAGPAGGAASRLLDRFADEFGVARSDYQVLDDPWTDVPDVFFILGNLLPPDSVRRFAGFKLFSFGDATQLGHGTVAESLVLRYPRLRTFVLPEQLYSGLNTEAVLTLSVRSVLVSSAGFDEQHAYEIAAQLFEHAQELAAVYPLVTHELGRSFDESDLSLPLHSGVRRYLDKDKPGFVERYIDVIALALTVAAALISTLVRIYNRRQQSKKDQVDVYYERILDLRARIGPEITAEQAAKLTREVKQVQQDVFALLVDERVNADATLTIFLDLSNQVLHELERSHAADSGAAPTLSGSQ